nr:hypothetical protein [Ardenticatena sp.]
MVILTVITVQYGDEPPPDFDAWQTARQIARDIKRLYEENQSHPEVWQDRFTNAGSYVMYRLFNADEHRMGEWGERYRRLAPRLLQQEENNTPTPTPTVIVPPPFLGRPYATATPFPTPTPMTCWPTGALPTTPLSAAGPGLALARAPQAFLSHLPLSP